MEEDWKSEQILQFGLHVKPDANWVKVERSKGRELRKSQWWRQQVGKGICHHCGLSFLPQELTMDHLIPISMGGRSQKKNCVPSCKSCNSEKSARPHFHPS